MIFLTIISMMVGFMTALSGAAAAKPVIQSVLPPQGVSVGQIVTIRGSGFLLNSGPNYQTSNNRIYITHAGATGAVQTIPPGYIFFVSATAIKFTMPSAVEGGGGPPTAQPVTEKLAPGPYQLSVGNVHGRSNEVVLTYHPTPAIRHVSPDSGTIGTVISIEGSGFTATDNWIGFPSNRGLEGAAQRTIPGIPSPDGKHLKFSIPAKIQVIYLDYSGGGRPRLRQTTQEPRPGTYKISVGNCYGKSNLVPFTFYLKQPLK